MTPAINKKLTASARRIRAKLAKWARKLKADEERDVGYRPLRFLRRSEKGGTC